MPAFVCLVFFVCIIFIFIFFACVQFGQTENIRKLSNVFCHGVDRECKCCTRLATFVNFGENGNCGPTLLVTHAGLRIDFSFL